MWTRRFSRWRPYVQATALAMAEAQMEFITCEGAQHCFTKPGPAYQEKADKESWAAMKKFFAEILR